MFLSIVVEVLEEFLTRQILAAADDAGEPRIIEPDIVGHAALAFEVQPQVGAVNVGVAVLERRQSE